MVATALPGSVLAVVVAGMLIMAAGGRHPLWRTQPLNMSEAAALRDAATVLHMIRAGESASEPRIVRAGYLRERALTLTPLDAAVVAARPEIVELLVTEARIGPPEWTRARCLAARVRDSESERVLDAYKPAGSGSPGGDVDCSGITPLQ